MEGCTLNLHTYAKLATVFKVCQSRIKQQNSTAMRQWIFISFVLDAILRTTDF